MTLENNMTLRFLPNSMTIYEDTGWKNTVAQRKKDEINPTRAIYLIPKHESSNSTIFTILFYRMLFPFCQYDAFIALHKASSTQTWKIGTESHDSPETVNLSSGILQDTAKTGCHIFSFLFNYSTQLIDCKFSAFWLKWKCRLQIFLKKADKTKTY